MELANGIKNKFFSQKDDENKYYIKEVDADQFWYNNYLHILADEISNSSRVLDIGCAQGKLGKKLHEKNCKLFGIEINDVASREAKESGYYEKIFIYDLEDDDEEEFAKIEQIVKKVDVVVLSDILEHLVNPTKVLLKFTKMLVENGIILVGIPNISNLDIVLHLLNDEFNYSELGILDNTHLKFFTKKSFAQWIQEINDVSKEIKFDCQYLGNTFYKSDYVGKIEKLYPELYQILLNSVNYNAFQIYFKLKVINRKEQPSELNRIINEKNIDVVDLLGKLFQGGKIDNLNFKISNNERLWLNDIIKNNESQITEALGYIKKLEESNGKKQNQIDEALVYIKELEENNGKKQNQIDEALVYIKELEENSGKKQNQIDEALVYIKELEENSGKKQNQIDEALVYIKELEENDGKKQNQIDEALGYIKELEESNGKNQSQIEEALLYIKSLENQISELNRNVDIFKDEKANMKDELIELEKNIKNIKLKLNLANEKIFNMENSLSWKITKILRK